MPIRDLILVMLVPISWAMGFTLSKLALHEFSPLFLMSMRFLLATLVLIWFVPFPRRYLSHLFWIALVGSTIQYGLTFTGLSQLDASLAIVIVHLEVPFSVLLAVLFFKEKPGILKLTGMVIAFVGIVIISGLPSLRGQITWILLTASGALAWAIGQIMFKRISNHISGMSAVAWIGAITGPQMLFASFMLEDNQLQSVLNATWIGWGVIIYLGIIMTVMGYGIWYTILARNTVSNVIPVLLSLPVFTIAFAMLILGEEPSVEILLGAAIVIIGVGFIVIPEMLRTFQRSQ